MPRAAHQAKLESLGLSAGEAQVYLTLLRSGGTLGATALASATGLPRTGVYPLLNSLVQKGIVEAEAGYGSRFTAIHPTQALPALVARERERQLGELQHRERMAADLVEELDSLAEPAGAVDADSAGVIQVLRDPRVITARFERLQDEAEQQIEVCVKAPFFMGPVENTAQEKALRRGVRARALYERAILDAPEVRPYLERWVAKGEEARVYDGELPHKLALFDRRSLLLPLFMPGDQVRTLFVRHQPLATSLGMLFDTFWERAEPITVTSAKKRPRAGKRRQPHSPLS
jgi:HTH-type transcriptional regulator, sugar sensing transcriptional regulator